MNAIGTNIKLELERRKMSQKELCNLTGITEANMSKYLNNSNYIRTDIVAKISRALNVPINQLLGISDNGNDTFNVCKTALLARSGNKLTDEEKRELINLIFGHE